MLPGFLKHDYLARLGDIVPELRAREPGRLYSPQRAGAAARRPARGRGAGHAALGRSADAGRRRVPRRARAHRVADRLGTIFFTSGTTAQAKAVVHCHAALTTSARRIGECLGVTPDDAWWGHMPLFWSGGFILGALATMAGGGRVVLQETVDPGSALRAARGGALHDHGRLASGRAAARPSGLRAPARCI